MITLAAPHTLEQEVKHSRFIAVAARADTPEDALAFLDSVRRDDANHNCWAYRIGDEYRFNDDGEPGGTAGRPILAAIEGQGIDNAVVVVIRYFGGIKLGAGGLVRAYGGAAAECLRTANRVEIVPQSTLRLEIPFDSIGNVYPVLDRHGARKIDEGFDETGAVLTVEVASTDAAEFTEAIMDATRGKAKVEGD